MNRIILSLQMPEEIFLSPTPATVLTFPIMNTTKDCLISDISSRKASLYSSRIANNSNASSLSIRSVSPASDLMQHPSNGDNGDGGDFGGSEVGGGVAQISFTVIDASLDVVVGGVVVFLEFSLFVQ